ncbi:MAG: Si-specific NAD(P)(+) transhydrogenase [Candidatus Eisenbacteria bacterium]|uniref:NAD(P)(+) transhydrogenase (Si-specific) n=1 Tax=Eiseniibacteriota bacterium TaxID=2212470 RepID=A0A538SFM0_UNCEI|nr:MAG: Si-specific NAD(P)(+) transhydrogenase [Candidatus Eisenbacteria bacterium]
MQDFDMVVIGSGPSGQRAAVQAAKLGKQVAVVERYELGGVSINGGTIPSKTLREAVIDLSGLRQRSLYGDSFRVKAEISAQDLLMRTGLIMQREREVVRSQLLRNHVHLVEGAARFEGPHELVVDGRDATHRLQARYVVIAVGSTPGIPPGIEVDHRAVLTSDDILSLETLPRSLTVVGAGIIGVEYATIFAALGIEVVLLDKRPSLLEMVDAELVDALTYQARALGVTLRLGEEVERLEPGAAQTVVRLKSGKRFVTEMVLISAGRVGATTGLGLDRAGVATDERGRIGVNEHYQTSVPHIYAVGDVIGFPALASTSMEQGRLAACHAFGIPATSVPALFPFGIYAIPEVAWVGSTEADLTSKGAPFETGVARYREIARGQILGDSDGMLKLIFRLDTGELLGVWVLGTHAAELVHIGQAVMALGGTLDYFITNVFNYPTLAECYKVAALDGYNKVRSLNAVPARQAAGERG